MRVSTIALVGSFLLVATIAGCGGGSGGSSPGGGSSVIPTPTPTPSSASVPLAISGTATEFTSGTALSGFTVVVGQLPNAQTCNAMQTASTNACGAVVSPQPAVSTSASGSFSVTVPTAGTYMLTISNGASYATLHRTVTVTTGLLGLGTVKVAALSADEQAWVADLNAQRATVSVPVSFGNLVVDEYAEEQARAEVAAIVSGAQPYGDPTESLFTGYYAAMPGAMYAAGGVAALRVSASAYLSADAVWMAEKATCPSENWQT
jgi:hypothetical protein